MTRWNLDDIARIAAADQIAIAPERGDGTRRPYTTIWVVRVDDGLYVRSYRGPGGAWFRSEQ